MADRAYMLPIRSGKDVAALRDWLNDRAWSLDFRYTCKRDDGSIWALVNADTSRCTRTLSRHGYRASGVLILGDSLEWDSASGSLGKAKDALYSAYLDARQDEFFPLKSPELKAQQGNARVFLAAGKAPVENLREAVAAQAANPQFRLMPTVEDTVYRVTDDVATPFGVLVERLTTEGLRLLVDQLGIEALPPRKLPKNIMPGVEYDKTVCVFQGNGRPPMQVPLADARLSAKERAALKGKNETEAFMTRFESIMRKLGFEPCGGGYGTYECASTWELRHPSNFDVEATAEAKENQRNGAIVRRINLEATKNIASKLVTLREESLDHLNSANSLESLPAELKAFEQAVQSGLARRTAAALTTTVRSKRP